MSRIKDFFEKLFPVKAKYGSTDSIVIDIPSELYYKELALYTASSLIGNAISRSEIKCFENNAAVKNSDYFKLNVSPNRNETSSYFWHKIINNVIRNKKALVVEAGGYLYCADSFSIEEERPILGDKYSAVTIENFTFKKIFNQNNTYLFRLNDVPVNTLLDGMYEEYSKIMGAAVKAFKRSHAQKYKLHLSNTKSGDSDFDEYFKNVVSKQLATYLKSDDAVYPEFEGYSLDTDKSASGSYSATDFINLKKELFETFAAVFHIPVSMMTGNITNMKEIVASFLSFGVDPYADMISEALNKGAGAENFLNGNYYKVDTSYINHRDIFELAAGISNLISSGTCSIDEIREKIDLPLLNTDYSKKHFITKNFEEIDNFCSSAEGGD